VDVETLEICAEEGIKFVILAPHQGHRLRGSKKIDPKSPYLLRLPSKKTISIQQK